MKHRRIISAFAALLLAASLPISALAKEWYLEDGNITVSASADGQTVQQGSNDAVGDQDVVITRRNTDRSTSNAVTINAEKDQTASVTLKDVAIEGCGKNAAISTGGEGDVTIELDGNNKVTSGVEHAGLEKGNQGNLEITDKNSDGTLIAKGTGGAGIGGGYGQSVSNITISGGEITAIGDYAAAGIGGGQEGVGSNITVSGNAKVKTRGGSGYEPYGTGAGIGNGSSFRESGSEVEPDTSKLTTDGKIEYYAPGADMATAEPTKTVTGTYVPPQQPSEDPSQKPSEKPTESAPSPVSTEAVTAQPAAAPLFRVTDENDKNVKYTTQWKDGVLTITAEADFAILTGRLSGIASLKAQGIEKIVFTTNGATSAFAVADLLETGAATDAYALAHKGEAVTFTLGEADVSGILVKA